jgi:CRISPR-associated protein Cas5d
MSYGIRIRVWGDLASFNRPEMKVERVSYDVITPSAARGILEAIYWKPQFRWVIDRIHVLRPIRFTHVRRNEISSRIPVKGKTGVTASMKAAKGHLGILIEDYRQQRAGMILRDVCYGVEAHVEVTDPTEGDGTLLAAPEAKHLEAFKRRAEKGQYFHHPYLGSREFPADFELVDSFPECPDELNGERDLGFMLQDITFVPDRKGKVVESNMGKRLSAQPRFFRAVMRDGVIEVPALEEARAST